jgi:predicted acyltransferase
MAEKAEQLKDRIISVDILRGLAMFLILSTQIGGALIWRTLFNLIWGEKNWPQFVTNQMSWSNEHVSFMNIAQSIFLFVVGVVIPFSMRKRLDRNDKSKIYLQILIRSAILFLFGLIAGGKLLNLPQYNRTLANIPVYNNVLEYIAITYLVVCIIVLNTKVKTQYIITGVLLLLYWFVWYIPAPGGIGEPFSKEMNIGIYVEKLVLGNHASGFGAWTGVFNTVGHIMLALIGALCGHLLFFSAEPRMNKFKKLLIAGIAMIVVGELWGLVYPVMRCFMTSTFVLVSGGVGVVLLACFYYLNDIRGHTRWSFFFYVFGVNSIAIYMMAHTFDFKLIGNVVVGGFSTLFPPAGMAFIQNVTAMIVMWLIMLYMYRKRTFLKL